MDEFLRTIVEVQEGGKNLANHYLQHGYLLLDVQSGARQSSFPSKDSPGHQYQYYVRRNPVYVVGRPEGISPAPPMSPRGDTGERAKTIEEVRAWLYPQFGEANNELRALYEGFCQKFGITLEQVFSVEYSVKRGGNKVAGCYLKKVRL